MPGSIHRLPLLPAVVLFALLAMGATVAEGSDPQELLEPVLVPVTPSEAVQLAESYFDRVFPAIEPDMVAQFRRMVPGRPGFAPDANTSRGPRIESADVALAVSYTNARNFYLALACAAFDADRQSVDAATNVATALATYYDDLVFQNRSDPAQEQAFYADASKMYSHAVALGRVNGQYDKACVPAIASLGNLLLDLGRLDAAEKTFQAALLIDEQSWPARTGLYNTCMAKGQTGKALEMIARDARFYPVMARTVAEIGKEVEQTVTVDDQPDEAGEAAAEAAAEKKMDQLNGLDAVTAADFIQALDPRAARKMKQDMERMQGKMRYQAPDISFLTRYASFEAAWSPAGRGAFIALEQGLNRLQEQTIAQETETAIKGQLGMLEQFGVTIDPGFDVENIGAMIQDAMRNPEKYENFDPQVSISGLGGLEKQLQDYEKDTRREVGQVQRKGDSGGMYAQLARTRPEYRIMLINPYHYLNANDLLIQRYNIMLLGDKRGTYNGYLEGVNLRAGSAISEIYTLYNAKALPIIMEYETQKREIEASDRAPDEQKVALHRLHTGYYNKLNQIGEPYWKQASEIACVAYKKIERYAPQMYNDCLKHVMLISDPEVRDRLDAELRGLTTTAVKNGISNVLLAYGFAPYHNPAACECDDEEIEALRRQIEARTEAAANEQILANIQAKKNFDEGVLDENSKYYKEFIERYEYELDFGVFKEKVSPYKSHMEFDLGALGTHLNLKSATNHIRNTTTYDGGISAGLSGGPVGGRTYWQFTATRNGQGDFTLNDTTWGVEVSAGAGPASATAAFEASAVRGTRVRTQAVITGDPYLDKLKIEAAGQELWKPDIAATMWEYDYSTDWSGATAGQP